MVAVPRTRKSSTRPASARLRPQGWETRSNQVMAAHDPADARAGAVPGEALLATVVTGLPQDGNDVRRRDMITRTAALAGAAALGRAPGGTGTPRRPAAGLEDVL